MGAAGRVGGERRGEGGGRGLRWRADILTVDRYLIPAAGARKPEMSPVTVMVRTRRYRHINRLSVGNYSMENRKSTVWTRGAGWRKRGGLVIRTPEVQ